MEGGLEHGSVEGGAGQPPQGIDGVGKGSGDIGDRLPGPVAVAFDSHPAEVVGGSEETSYSVGYAELVAVLIEAIKEQQTYIKEQDERIVALEEKIK